MKNTENFLKVLKAYHDALGGERGWLDVHMDPLRPTNFGLQILIALTEVENKQAELGVAFVKELADVPYYPSELDAQRWRDNFETLIQKLAELIVLKAICSVEWEKPFQILIEPTNGTTGKKPDFVVNEAGHNWLFEVKCPAFIKYEEIRRKNLYQLPVRSFLHDLVKDDPGGLTLPRDNVVKDFLSSAEEKFSNFSRDQTSVLVIVWDSHIYEAVSILKHTEAGLLTPKSWHKNGAQIVSFSSVDHVLVLNKMDDLVAGAQEQKLVFGHQPFMLDREHGLPAVWCANDEEIALQERILKSFDAWPYDGTSIAADYALTDAVLWLNPFEIAQRRRRLWRRLPYLLSASHLPHVFFSYG